MANLKRDRCAVVAFQKSADPRASVAGDCRLQRDSLCWDWASFVSEFDCLHRCTKERRGGNEGAGQQQRETERVKRLFFRQDTQSTYSLGFASISLTEIAASFVVTIQPCKQRVRFRMSLNFLHLDERFVHKTSDLDLRSKSTA
jgi:hypothetical protein